MWFEAYKELVFSRETSLEKIEKALELKFRNLPHLFYKYREVNCNSLKNLEEDTIWLADPKNFNDPYDCSFKIKPSTDPSDSDSVIDMAVRAGLLELTDLEAVSSIRNSKKPMSTLMEKCYPEDPDYGSKVGNTLSIVLNEQSMNLISEASNGFKQTFKVCSFSEKPDSMLMWSHYANYHTGFCLAYDFRSLGVENIITRCLCPVVYSRAIALNNA